MSMVNWQATVATIYCDAVGADVTIVVSKDWSVKCTGYINYGESSKDGTKLLKKRSRKLKRQFKCVGPECDRVIRYREKLFSQGSKEVLAE
jgi:hypothetical protein